tara:strand:- start:656 stop:892 length:237 start_codon:yes stop_codon:yes gene_type:complete
MIKRKLKQWFNAIKYWFLPEYEITVFRTQDLTGNVYKDEYVSKKIIIQKEKHLKFRDKEKRVVELRSAKGLDYRIKEL